MKFKIIGSSSSGNCYILQASTGEVIIFECGVRFDLIKKALNYNLSKVKGLCITHSHADHCKAVKEVAAAGIDIYATSGTISELVNLYNPNPHRLHPVSYGALFKIGEFSIIPFTTVHDTLEPCGFYFKHPECGNCVFITDSVYSPYIFKDVNNFLVEANYCDKILGERLDQSYIQKFLRDRVLNSHCSLNNCKDFLAANDLSQVNNIVILHLSDGNSDAKRFKREVEEQTGKVVHIASAGMELSFNKQPF